jgi:cell division protein FtsB
MSLPGDKKHITISLSDPTLTRYGDAIYDPTFLAIALDPLVSEKEKLKAARGVRNRLSAACSRQKRKELLDGLKDDNEKLKGENQILMEEIKRLRGGVPQRTEVMPVEEEKPLKAVTPPPAHATSPNGTIDPTALCSTTQSAHLVLIGELITTNQSLQQTITSLVSDRDSWKAKYESLMANIARLGAGTPHVGADKIKYSPSAHDIIGALPDSYVSSPTKSTTSTLVSEYLLDADIDAASPADLSMDLSEPSTAPSSSPCTPAATLGSPTATTSTTTLPQINTCHPAAVATFSRARLAGIVRRVCHKIHHPHLTNGPFRCAT